MGGHLRISRHDSTKPFLDGDFLRDSSNPLDVYEDMDITTPSPAASTPSQPTAGGEKKSNAKGPGKGKGAGDAAAKGTSNDESKGKGEGTTSAVQMKMATTLSTEEAADPTTAEPSVAKTEVASDPTQAPGTKKEAGVNVTGSASNASEVEANASNATEVKAAVPEPVKDHSSCVTRHDERAASFWSQTAAVGSPCIFGVDDRDEGSHCIAETDFGSNGWCYTQRDMSAWGSCSEGCPLYGPHAKLAKKIDGMASVLGKLSDTIDKLAAPQVNQ